MECHIHLLQNLQQYKSVLIKNMDHMSIWVLKPHQLSYAKRSSFKKLNNDAPKVPKQAEIKRYGVVNPQNNNFNHF